MLYVYIINDAIFERRGSTRKLQDANQSDMKRGMHAFASFADANEFLFREIKAFAR